MCHNWTVRSPDCHNCQWGDKCPDYGSVYCEYFTDIRQQSKGVVIELSDESEQDHMAIDYTEAG